MEDVKILLSKELEKMSIEERNSLKEALVAMESSTEKKEIEEDVKTIETATLPKEVVKENEETPENLEETKKVEEPNTDKETPVVEKIENKVEKDMNALIAEEVAKQVASIKSSLGIKDEETIETKPLEKEKPKPFGLPKNPDLEQKSPKKDFMSQYLRK